MGPQVLAAFLLLASPPVFADPPSYSIRPQTTPYEASVFIGHYGETIVYPTDWAIRPPRLNGSMEIVRFSHIGSASSSRISPAAPLSDSDYDRPENYAPLGLAQLLVIPKGNGGYADIRELRRAKSTESAKKGLTFTIDDAPLPAQYWPQGTFKFVVTAPYPLIQVYAEHAGKVYILTGAPGNNFSALSDGLGKYLDSAQRAAGRDDDSPRLGGLRLVSLPLLGIGLLMFVAPWKRLSRPLAAAALCAAAASSGLGIGGFYLARWLCGLGKADLVSPGFIGWCVVMIASVAVAINVLRNNGWKRAVLGAAALFGTMFLMALAAGIGDEIAAGKFSAPYDFSNLTWAVGLIHGFFFGLSMNLDASSGRPAAALISLILLGIATTASAQYTPGEIAEATRRVDENTSIPILERLTAQKEMERWRTYNLYQRVELDGIIAHDKTPAALRKFFDGPHLQPSHNNIPEPRVERSPDRGWVQRLIDRAKDIATSSIHGVNNDEKDINDLFDDKTGRLTERGRETLAPLMDRNIHVNEIVAHSWGAVLLHNAILDGLVNPPKRIIIVGLPDDDVERWRLLAKYTGTQVILAQNEFDVAVPAGRLGDRLLDSLPHGRSKDYSDGTIAAKWLHWQEHYYELEEDKVLPEGDVTFRPLFIPRNAENPFGHDRLKYFQALKDAGILDQTAEEMRAEQDAALEGRIQELREQDIQAMAEQIKTNRLMWNDIQRQAQKNSILAEETARRLAAAERQEQQRRLIAALEGCLRFMKGLVSDACRNGGGISQDDMAHFQQDWDFLWSAGQGTGYAPRSAIDGLSGCEERLMTKLVKNHEHYHLASNANEAARQSIAEDSSGNWAGVGTDRGESADSSGRCFLQTIPELNQSFWACP